MSAGRPCSAPIPIWTPDPAAAARSEIERFRHWVNDKVGVDLTDYHSLWAWSVDQLEQFWAAVWDFYEVTSGAGYEAVLSRDTMPGARWFTGATLNYAEHTLRHPATDEAAIIETNETGAESVTTWFELHRQVAALANRLRTWGIGPGDCVAAYLPNCSAAVVSLLATASIGALWSACGPDYGASGATDRLGQLDPAVLIAADGYHYAGQVIDRTHEVRSLIAAMPSLQSVITVPHIGLSFPAVQVERVVDWSEATDGDPDPVFERVPFEHPLWVLFTSGTTGNPKGIVHGHGGVLLEHLALLGLQFDITPRDRFFWFTTTNWMMWNLQASALLRGATILAYDGSPTYPTPDRMFALLERHGISVFGTSPGFLLASQKSGLTPGLQHDLSALKVLGSTGAPLSAASYHWVHDNVGAAVQLCSTSGGTDVVGSFVGGAATVPVYPGEISALALGAAIDSWSPDGKPVRDDVGELVITRPMPSMPLYFWGDPDGSRYHEAYFDTYPGVWRHGDWITITSRHTAVMHGRSDATLNRRGVRLGSAEVYAVVDTIPEIAESAIVGIEEPNGGYWMPLFVVLAPGFALDAALIEQINSSIRTHASPRHVPDEVIAVPALLHTRTGKKLEVPLKRLLQGNGVNAATVDDPSLIEIFERLGRERATRRGPDAADRSS